MYEKFDYVFSNPPYQNASNMAIFHHFQVFSDKVADKTILIYPADKWMSKTGKGAGFDEFTDQQLSSKNLKKITVYENSNKVFDNIALHGGISIVEKDMKINNKNSIIIESYEHDGYHSIITVNSKKLTTLSTSNRMNIIVDKVTKKHIERDKHKNSDTHKTAYNLSDSLLSSAYFGVSSNFIERSTTCIKDENYHGEEGYIKVLTNSSSGKGGRVAWFWVPEGEIQKNKQDIDKFTIALSSRHAAGYAGRSQHAFIYEPGVIFGDCRFGVAQFDTRDEAENFMKWMGTDIIRTLIYSSSRRVGNFGVNVPLLKDYTNNSSEVDFTQKREQINEQLIQEYDFDEDDLIFIQQLIQGLGSFEMPGTRIYD